jgi:hypothetical protein
LNEKSILKLLFCFLKEKIGEFFMLVAFAAITAVVFSLYDMEVEPLGYALLLCVLFYVVCLAFRFLGYFRQERERRELLREQTVSAGQLAAPKTLAECEYREMIEKLGQRCRDLATDREKEKQEMIDYYSTWVHQIKTPIAVMRMQLQGDDTEENRALLAELFRIEQYVEMVLSYIRLGSSQNDFVIKEYELDEIIRQAVRKFAPQFVHEKIKLIYEPTAERVITDEKWLLFIMEQLISNAIKYTPNGTVTIAVSERQILSVADTGIGIAPEDLPRIFEKGFTGYNGRADKKATGLGLYLCRQAAGKLGIRIWAESTPGAGSTFYLDLHREKIVVE